MWLNNDLTYYSVANLLEPTIGNWLKEALSNTIFYPELKTGESIGDNPTKILCAKASFKTNRC